MTIEREIAPARLRTRYMLFGVIVASAASSIATHYALCDRDGSPACGNIGQAGTPLPPPSPPPPAAPLTVTVVAQTAPLVEISISQQLVAPRIIEPVVARPLTDERGDFMPGNVMTKGGRRH